MSLKSNAVAKNLKKKGFAEHRDGDHIRLILLVGERNPKSGRR